MLTNIIIALTILFSTIALVLMLRDMKTQRQQGTLAPLSKRQLKGFGIIALLAFIADTIGIGSFAVEIAGCKIGKLINDKDLPGLINGAQIIPGILESILFLHIIHVDMTTLITLVIGCCIGGVFGGLVVSRLNQRMIQSTMMIAFFAMAILLFCNQMGWIHISGKAQSLHGIKLILGAIGMVVAGMLTSVGVGLYGVVEVLLLLLGLNPLIAFPIMTTAGALQQPFTTSTFALTSRIPLKAAFYMMFIGIAGVLIALPFVTHLSIDKLHWLLLIIIIYNAIMMLRSLYKNKSSNAA